MVRTTSATVLTGLRRYSGVGTALLAIVVLIALFPSADPPEEIVSSDARPGPAEILVPSDQHGLDGASSADEAGSASAGQGGSGTVSGGDQAGPAPTASAGGSEGLPPNCDPATGRIRFPSVFAPPCVPSVDDNGGATYPGVTDNEILLVVYIPQPDPALDPILQSLGVLDTPEQVEDTWYGFVDIFETHYETYGRRVRLEVKEGTGPADDAVAARADAVDVATRLRPFAVFASAAPSAFNEELAQRGTVVFNLLQYPQSWWESHQPYVYGTQLSCTQTAMIFGEYVGKRLANHNAIHAGDPAYHDQPRRFGLILGDNEERMLRQCGDTLEDELARYDVALTDRVTYEIDPARLAEQARVIMARLKDKGVTSILFMSEFVSGLIFPPAATNAGYFPEWILPGGNLMDANYLGRLYDPDQWKNAFGLSQLWIRPPQEQNEVYYQYVWHHGHPPPARSLFEVIYQEIWLLFTGIHMAGPNLTPQTFQAGLFNFPAAADGMVTQVRKSFGPGGMWPFPSYTAWDNVGEIWWDPDAVGPDEVGNVAEGMFRWVDGGRRYGYGQIPASPSRAFDPAGAPTHLDDLPESDRFPEYPSPR